MKQFKARRILPAARGFSLISAIFLLVVLSALGTAMMMITNTSQTSSAQDIQGERAYLAARAGIEWGLFQQLRLNQCAANTSFPLPAGSTLSNFTVTVLCLKTPGATSALDRYTLTATACNQPASGACPHAANANDAEYAQRVVMVQF